MTYSTEDKLKDDIIDDLSAESARYQVEVVRYRAVAGELSEAGTRLSLARTRNVLKTGRSLLAVVPAVSARAPMSSTAIPVLEAFSAMAFGAGLLGAPGSKVSRMLMWSPRRPRSSRGFCTAGKRGIPAGSHLPTP